MLGRETLHILDDTRRIAMVETKTVDADVSGTLPIVPRVRYQYSNHLDSAHLECDEDGLVISYEEYHPYGTPAYRSARSGIEVSEKRYRYTGKERDDETGLQYHSARYYAPWLARWTTSDPKRLAGGIALFVYAADNPTKFVDLDGREPLVRPHDRRVDKVLAGKMTAGELREGDKAEAVGSLVGLAVAISIFFGPAAVPSVLANTGKAYAGLSAVVGVVDPHPAGFSPMDMPGFVDDITRAATAPIKKEIQKKLAAKAEEIVEKPAAKAVEKVAEKIAPKVEAKAASETLPKAAAETKAALSEASAPGSKAAVEVVEKGKPAVSVAAQAAEESPVASTAGKVGSAGANAAKEVKSPIVVKEGKWDYFFGRVTSNPHNQARSLQNAKELEKLGFTEAKGGREALIKLFEQGKSLPEVSRHVTEHGITITRTVKVGEVGAIDVKYFYAKGDMSSAPEISTIIPKIFKHK